MKVSFAIVVMAFLASANAAATVKEIHPYPGYNCSGVADGNYPHPEFCTKFVSCSGGISSQRECAACHVDAVRCPDGQLLYEPSIDGCIWANQATCTGIGRPPPTTPPQSTIAPPSGDDCDPTKCLNQGYCQWFQQCNNETRKWGEKQECGQDLVWNPRGQGEIHGGNCDTWTHLDADIEELYRSDPDCLGCFWKTDGCTAKYKYQPPALLHRDPQNLTCSEGLLFDLSKTTCQRCEDAKDNNGNPCPC